MKLGRNEMWHCGSGQKYKRCCLQADATRARNIKAAADRTEENVMGGGATAFAHAIDRVHAYDQWRKNN